MSNLAFEWSTKLGIDAILAIGCQSLHSRNISGGDSFALKASGLNVELGSGGISRKVCSLGAEVQRRGEVEANIGS